MQGAHTNPQRSAQAQGVKFTLVRVEDATDGDQRVDPGHAVRVVFLFRRMPARLSSPRAMANLRLILSGPTTDYRLQDYNRDGEEAGRHPERESHAGGDARNAQGRMPQAILV